MVEVAAIVEGGANDGLVGGDGDGCYLVATMVVEVVAIVLMVDGDDLINGDGDGGG